MTLFQAREWWSKKPDHVEECDKGCLCIANIDNDPKHTDKIITGSFSGHLRIYYPKGPAPGYKIEDLLLEICLDEPILQLQAGRFIPNQSGRLSLAVLHPRRLCVYSVTAVSSGSRSSSSSSSDSSSSSVPSYYDLSKSYEHKLDRLAYNFCIGPFGGVYGRDFIAVQSMDGQLMFFEQDNFAFSRYLNSNEFLIPGPICYVAKIDSFVTINSANVLECYKYQMLGASTAAKNSEADDKHGLISAKKVQVDWSVNVGERVLDIFVARYSKSLAASQVDILVCGEKTLFTLKETGAIRLQKRFDYNPSAALTYNTAPYMDDTNTTNANAVSNSGAQSSSSVSDVGGSNQNLIIATHQHSLMIYRDTQLIWAARTSSSVHAHANAASSGIGVAVDMKLGTFNGVRNFIVILTGEGEVRVLFLGTDPPVTSVTDGVGPEGGGGGKELDYEAMDGEHRKLLKTIRQASTDSLAEPKDKISLRAQVFPKLIEDPNDGSACSDDTPSAYTGSAMSSSFDESDCVRGDGGGPLTCSVRLTVLYNGKEDLTNVQISLSCSAAFHIKGGERSLMISHVPANVRTPIVIPLKFRASKTKLPASMKVDVVCAYVTPKNEPRTAKCDFHLPLTLAAKAVAPLKNAQYMFTLDSNRQPPTLTDLFPDLLEPLIHNNSDMRRVSSNMITAVFFGGSVDVTILLSKKSGRYRLQSGVFEALSLLSHELSYRLYSHYAKIEASGGGASGGSSSPPFAISFSELLPLHDYFLLIDRHFSDRQRLFECRELLGRVAHQFRVIQKRLLVRFKDKNPTPLNNLDTLLHETTTKLRETARQYTTIKQSLFVSANALSCATSLMLLLIAFKYELDIDNVDVLKNYLSPHVHVNECDDYSWEEYVDASMTYLLRTSLAKNGKDKDNSNSQTSNAVLEKIKDTVKLKRHIQIVCDRLQKGLRIVKKEEKEKSSKKGGGGAIVAASSPNSSSSSSSPTESGSSFSPSSASAGAMRREANVAVTPIAETPDEANGVGEEHTN